MRVRSNLKYLLVLGLTIALVAPATAQIGSSQSGNAPANLRTDLERTDQLIERARDAVRASNSVRAQLALENAENLQTSAWEQFNLDNLAGYRQAATLTRQAREQAKKALVSASYIQQGPDAVQRRLERAEELLSRVKEELGPSQNRRLTDLCESAEDNLRTAWEFYRDGEYRPALKLANQVDNAVRRIISVSNRQMQGTATFERYLDNVRETLEATRRQVAECDSETAVKLMEQARSSFELAMDLSEKDKPRMAVDALQTAKKLATQARLDCGGLEGTLAERYERIRSEVDQLSETTPAENKEAWQLIDQVYEQLDLARNYIDDGDTKAAAASLKAAELTLKQVIKLLDATTE
ncbi:MAG: hypothetical protein JSW34_06635 [Candidatus Zixiibacteriota bacterium]|nr:MAG: hypothetical protein JSW34_06635 [candidate division Zixibacteria bacterium]